MGGGGEKGRKSKRKGLHCLPKVGMLEGKRRKKRGDRIINLLGQRRRRKRP